MISIKRFLAFVFVAATAAIFSGCKSVPLDASGTNIGVYQNGEFQGLHNSTAPVVTKAVRDALPQFQLTETFFTDKQFSSYIAATTAKGDLNVQIWVEETNSRQTLLRIRWGLGGNLAKSQALYNTVDAAVMGQPSK